MTLLQAVAYFSREATLNLLRGWRVSLLAVLTIAVSLFLTGVFLLMSSNLESLMERWRSESKIIVYLEQGLDDGRISELRSLLAEAGWVDDVALTTAQQARERFQQSFPSMTGLLQGWGEEPLPASLEASVVWSRVDRGQLEEWLQGLRSQAGITMVDDDRDWLGQVRAVSLILQGLGLVLGMVLLGTAIFTISSVIRLTAYLYRDEIGVMRLVGATEFFIRGPFYVEGLLQGLAGGLVAGIGLVVAHSALSSSYGQTLVVSVLAGQAPSTSQVFLVLLLGSAAGLVGAITSLRGEELGSSSEGSS